MPLILALVLILLAQVSYSEESWNSKGVLKYHGKYFNLPEDALLAEIGGETQTPQNLNLRLMIDTEASDWLLVTHYQLDFLFSPDENLTTGSDIDKGRLFDLTHSIIDQEDKRVLQRLDRLYAHYRSDDFSVKLGRQAVTWGNAFFFHAMDLFNPFSPIALDTEYKPGDDMLYADWLFSDGSDLQALLVPKRNAQGKLAEDSSSAAIKYRTLLNDVEIDILASRHEGSMLGGIGVARSVGESMGRLDLVVKHQSSGDLSYSLVTNVDYSWVAFERNMYGYVEYYHNGDDSGLAGIPLTTSDYYGAGLQIELHPLIGFTPSVLGSIDDKSGLIYLSSYYNMKQDFIVNASLIVPFGPNDSEYNGPSTLGRSVSILLNYYF